VSSLEELKTKLSSQGSLEDSPRADKVSSKPSQKVSFQTPVRKDSSPVKASIPLKMHLVNWYNSHFAGHHSHWQTLWMFGR
jgi:hypothetical protein